MSTERSTTTRNDFFFFLPARKEQTMARGLSADVVRRTRTWLSQKMSQAMSSGGQHTAARAVHLRALESLETERINQVSGLYNSCTVVIAR